MDFVDANAADYHLAEGSAAIDSGIEIADVSFDRDGLARPQAPDHPYDMGAYEFCGEGCGAPAASCPVPDVIGASTADCSEGDTTASGSVCTWAAEDGYSCTNIGARSCSNGSFDQTVSCTENRFIQAAALAFALAWTALSRLRRPGRESS